MGFKNNVLVIDEMYFSRHIIKSMLSGCSVTVFEAVSLSEGLEIFQEHKPSAIIIGASLANDYGLYLAKMIKKHNSKVKIIFIFKKAVKETVYNVFSSGGNALLVLPISKERLLSEFSPQAGTKPHSNLVNF